MPCFSLGETKYRLDHPARVLPLPQQQCGGWLNSDAVEDAKRLGYSIIADPGGSTGCVLLYWHWSATVRQCLRWSSSHCTVVFIVAVAMRQSVYSLTVSAKWGRFGPRRATVRGFRVLWVLEDTDVLGAVHGAHSHNLTPRPRRARVGLCYHSSQQIDIAVGYVAASRCSCASVHAN